MIGRTLVCVLIELEGWLDKTREMGCSGCGTPAHDLVSKFGSVKL